MSKLTEEIKKNLKQQLENSKTFKDWSLSDVLTFEDFSIVDFDSYEILEKSKVAKNFVIYVKDCLIKQVYYDLE